MRFLDAFYNNSNQTVGVHELHFSAGCNSPGGYAHVGNWNLHLVKSKTNSGLPDKSGMATFTAQNSGIRLVGDGVDAEGKPWHNEFRAKYDGKDYPIRGLPDTDMIAIKKLDANTWSENS